MVKTLQGKWVLIHKRLKRYRKYIFDEFIEEREGVFVMRTGKNRYYVYLNGEYPRVNLRL